MPGFPIVDAHVHLFDIERLRYGWLSRHPAINRSWRVPDYLEAMRGVAVERIVFAEAGADAGLGIAEAEWIAAADHPLIAGTIAAAPLENGARVAADLDRLAALPPFRAVRRITQDESDQAYCLRPGFVEAAALLGARGLVCDVCVFHGQLAAVVELARRCPDTQFVLDHLGKPAIRAGRLDPWRERIRQLAALPNVACKISGLVTEAGPADRGADRLRPFVEHALECFGFDRVLFGSDWPVLTLVATCAEWIDTLDRIVEGCSETEKRRLYRDNAIRIYRL